MQDQGSYCGAVLLAPPCCQEKTFAHGQGRCEAAILLAWAAGQEGLCCTEGGAARATDGRAANATVVRAADLRQRASHCLDAG